MDEFNNLKRSSDYRKRFFKEKRGIKNKYYFCPYCGKLLRNKAKIEVDHIISIKYAKRSVLAKKIFKKSKDGVNSIKNLTASCRRCNRRKGAKGGIWIVLGLYGIFFMPLIRVAFFIMVFYLLISNAPYLFSLIIENIELVISYILNLLNLL